VTVEPNENENEDEDLIRRAAGGDAGALAELWRRHHGRLRRMVALRLDRRLQGRVDPSDVLQEAYLDLSDRVLDHARDRPIPAYLWLRLVAGQRLMQVHRRHLGAAMRDAGREVSLHRGPLPPASSASLAAHLLGRVTSVSEAAVRAERRLQLQEALNAMDPTDREILALRHFEELTNGEVATLLGLTKTAASNRYIRALGRLRSLLEAIPGFLDNPTPS
jgi:RNA polymerase sigma-70 factor (ECF subfamily)